LEDRFEGVLEVCKVQATFVAEVEELEDLDG